MGDESFEKQRVEALFVIGHRGDYATKKRNVKRMRRVDDVDVVVVVVEEGDSSMLT